MKTLSSILLTLVLTSVILFTTNNYTLASSYSGDPECRGREKAALVDGKSVPQNLWQADCSYREPSKIWGKSVTLTTWGIINNYVGSSVNSVQIVTPNKAFIMPDHASLFAGYYSEGGAMSACRASTQAKLCDDLKPCPCLSDQILAALIGAIALIVATVIGLLGGK